MALGNPGDVHAPRPEGTRPQFNMRAMTISDDLLRVTGGNAPESVAVRGSSQDNAFRYSASPSFGSASVPPRKAGRSGGAAPGSIPRVDWTF
jgi:hypothetical protein